MFLQFPYKELPPLLLFTLFSITGRSQNDASIQGHLTDASFLTPVSGATVHLENTARRTESDSAGQFVFSGISPGTYALRIEHPDYSAIKMLLTVSLSENLDLESVMLRRSEEENETEDAVIAISVTDLEDDEGMTQTTAPILQASGDAYLKKAAFDFGQAYYKVRGYDSSEMDIRINGIPMNNFIDGRADWNQWGGLNDMIRNQEFTRGLEASSKGFGGLSGNLNINIHPSLFRKGLRTSLSLANRTYFARAMTTYNSGIRKGKLSYTGSISGRWARQGYMQGTGYFSLSAMIVAAYTLSQNQKITLLALAAPYRKGMSAPVTEEVFNLLGRRYNPYWGEQDGKIRNTRTKKGMEPMAILSHSLNTDRFEWITSLGYKFGKTARSRLGYYNAPNPDPVYYGYMPSYYINGTYGPDLYNAATAAEALKQAPQIAWETLYNANIGGSEETPCSYIMYDEHRDDKVLSFNTMGSFRMTSTWSLGAGISYRSMTSDNYAVITDLLGGNHHQDIDPFANTRNDLETAPEKQVGDRFNYSYALKASETTGFVYIKKELKKWSATLAARAGFLSVSREGHFKNEKYAEASLGSSEALKFPEYAIKGDMGYQPSGRHSLHIRMAYISDAPKPGLAFVNPRENNLTIPDTKNTTILSGELDYVFRFKGVTARLTPYYTIMDGISQIKHYYLEGGLGTGFITEVVSGMAEKHLGGELGVTFQVSPAVKLSLVGAVGNYCYTKNPNVKIYFDPYQEENGFHADDNSIDLGISKLEGYRVASGPQKAFSIGVEYRDPKYWWVSVSANALGNNFVSTTTINKTQSFLLDPETGEPDPDATPEAVSALTKQERLDDFYLLNLTAGKSWLLGSKYLSVFFSINNAFDTLYKSGGFEQSRKGNFKGLQKDRLSGTPSFANKYWYGTGRTCFLNISLSF